MTEMSYAYEQRSTFQQPSQPIPKWKELEPCPFCGSEAQADGSDEMWIVYCTKCPASMAFFQTREAAVRYWNRRDSDVQDAERLRAGLLF